MKAAGNRTCIITLRLSDFQSHRQVNADSFIKIIHTLTSGSGISPGRSFVSIVLEIDKRGDKENPPHFIHEVKEKGYVVIGGFVFPRKIMISPCKGFNLVRSKLLTHCQPNRLPADDCYISVYINMIR